MRLQIKHTTQFHYDEPPSYGLLQLRASPQSSSAQTVLEWEVSLDGARTQAQFIDQHGNRTDLISVLPDAQLLEISVSGEVDTLCADGILGAHAQAMPLWFYRRQSVLTKMTEGLRDLANSISLPAEDTLSGLHELSRVVRERVTYVTGQSSVATTAGDALENAKGVCQDHSHIFLSVVREKGFPARYVSGYLLMDDRTSQDASHAWSEVYLDGLGWVGFDVSNGISPDERYVRIAQGLDYADVAPTKGLTVGAGRENLVVSIQVQQ
ncbi:MAG: transglutaminase family protein [Hyphomonas sp.]|nr:transglutaminase family protein [Hyphomonas sp.]